MAYLLQRLLTEAAARHPKRPAIAADGDVITYTELDVLSNKVARALLRLGVMPGDRVGILAPKSAASVIGIFGVLKAGACYVPLDPKAPRQRLSYIVRDCAAAVIVADDARAAQAAALLDGERAPGTGGVVLTSPPDGYLDGQAEEVAVAHVDGPAMVPWTAVAAESAEALPEERSIETDLGYILYTSGSTGTPKGVMISHRNSLGFVEWAAAAAGLTEADRVCSPAPFRLVGLRRLREQPGRRLSHGDSRRSRYVPGDHRAVAGEGTDLGLVLRALGPGAPRVLWQLADVQPVSPASGDLRRGGVPASVPGPPDGRAATSALPQLVRPDRDKCVHCIRGPGAPG